MTVTERFGIYEKTPCRGQQPSWTPNQGFVPQLPGSFTPGGPAARGLLAHYTKWSLVDLLMTDGIGAAKGCWLINSVEAQRGNQLTDDEADALVAAAQAIIAAIEAQS